VLKYKAPSVSALPSLSTVGSDVLLPKNLSSNVSSAASAAFLAFSAFVAEVDASLAFVVAVVADEDAEVAELAAFVSEVAAAVAELAAFVAEVEAELADVVAEAASTIKSYFAEFAFVVKGVEPDEVCAVFTIKILLVEVSFTKSLAT
jgi:phage-related tail protein